MNSQRSAALSLVFLAVALLLLGVEHVTASPARWQPNGRYRNPCLGGVDRLIALSILFTTMGAFAVIDLRVGISKLSAVMSAVVVGKLFLADR